jgi:hypothetical protein
MACGGATPCSVDGCARPGVYRGPTALWLCDERAPLRGTCAEYVGEGADRRKCANPTAVVDLAGKRYCLGHATAELIDRPEV